MKSLIKDLLKLRNSLFLILNSLILAFFTMYLMPSIISNIIYEIEHINYIGFSKALIMFIIIIIVYLLIFTLNEVSKNVYFNKLIIYFKNKIVKSTCSNYDLGLIDKTKLDIVFSNNIKNFTEEFINTFGSTIQIIFAIFIGAYVTIQNSLVFLFGSIIILLVMMKINSKKYIQIEQNNNEFNKQNNKLISSIYDHIDNQTIVPFLCEDHLYNDYNRTSNFFFDSLLKIKKTLNSIEMTSRFGSLVTMTFILISGGLLSYYNLIEKSSIYFLILSVPQAITTILKIPEIIVSYKELSGHWDLINEYISDEIENCSKSLSINKIESINIKDLYYSYGEKDILKGVNFDINMNEFLLIKGISGSGKSTLIKLIAKLIYIENSIFINNIDLKELDFIKYCNNFCYLDQTPVIFDETIEYNITLGCNLGDIDNAINFVGLRKLIDLNKEGIKSKCINLSDGEKQKISLARAIYQEKSTLILDESLSAIDIESRELISKNLLKYAQANNIVIATSHEDQLSRYATQIITIKDGVLQ